MLITLVVGDWSGDGHSQTDKTVIESNLNSQEIGLAYNKAAKLIGFDFIEQVASDYQDNRLLKIDAEKIQKYIKLDNLETPYDEDEDEDDGTYYIDQDTYISIYLNYVKLGNPDFEFKIINIDEIEIGGYGLFYS